MKSYITNSKRETARLAERLAKKLKNHDIIFFKGGLGIDRNVTSPTFAIVNEYSGSPLSLFHFDMYRIETEDQLYNIGFYDYMDYDGVLAIEWSENILPFFSDANIVINFEKTGENQRKITIEGVDID